MTVASFLLLFTSPCLGRSPDDVLGRHRTFLDDYEPLDELSLRDQSPFTVTGSRYSEDVSVTLFSRCVG